MQVINGVFNVALEGFPNNIFSEDTRYLATFVNGTELTERKRLASVPYAINCGIPNAAVIMWSGNKNDIPEGWALCDGTSGRPLLIFAAIRWEHQVLLFLRFISEGKTGTRISERHLGQGII